MNAARREVETASRSKEELVEDVAQQVKARMQGLHEEVRLVQLVPGATLLAAYLCRPLAVVVAGESWWLAQPGGPTGS